MVAGILASSTAAFGSAATTVAERIGDYLVRTGKLSQAVVGQVIGAQKAGDGRTFGQIAVGLGLVDQAAVDSFLASQRK